MREQREAAWRTTHERWFEDREGLNKLYLDMLALRRQWEMRGTAPKRQRLSPPKSHQRKSAGGMAGEAGGKTVDAPAGNICLKQKSTLPNGKVL